ncbi:MAG: cytochrome c biogenesis protein CcsA [Campylobacterales bacterium]|nr:cytochrome c biogenesis protein CcsA [Campylobacterales bacterium]
MNTIIKLLGSMPTMAILMMVFALSIGTATFIENDFGTETAKVVVYNAKWFELLLGLLAVNLLINIFKFRMYRKERALVLLFHVSFFVVLIGAAITRYWGFEGVMHIREGEVQNEMLSAENHLGFVIEAQGKREHFSVPLYLSKITQNSQRFSAEVGGKPFEAHIVEYIPDATEKLVATEGGEAMASLMLTGEGMAPEQILLRKGEVFETEAFVLAFEAEGVFEKPVIALHVSGDTLQMSHPVTLGYLNMDDRSSGEMNASEATPLQMRRLYNHGRSSFVLRAFEPSAKVVLASADTMGAMATNLRDALRLSLRLGDTEREVWVRGVKGMKGEPVTADLGDVRIDVSYGAKVIRLPFALKLVDFQLERYPGSNAPSSYASEVVLMDKSEGIEQPFRIYMNHILDHRGYRFFQSSYDRDEQGTVLSVNNDPGTLPTYIGYAMMALGMFGALFVSGGRFSRLAKKAREASMSAAALLALLYLGTPNAAQAEQLDPIIKRVLSFDKAHAEQFGGLIVQDAQGRMKPMDTLSSEIVAKVNRGSSILGLSPNQIVLGMMLSPDAWREIAMIRTGNEALNKLLGIDSKAKYTSFSQFFEFPSEMGGYKLAAAADEASRKAPGKRNTFDKAVLQVDERVNVAYMVYTGALLRIWPAPSDPGNRWMATIEALQNLDQQSTEVIRSLAVNYFNAIDEGVAKGDWSKADAALEAIKAHQQSVGAAVYPSGTKIEAERLYNRLNVFERLWPWFFLIGFVLLFLSFARIIQPKLRIEWATRITMALLILFFIALSAGLAMRWYISGHAPWSDGYESLIYISWATVLAGFIFSKNSPITLAATGILAGLTLFVAHLSWMDPQITNLVPVLKSYWLSIHVSMITGSYGFLGLGALLGFIVLILFVLKNPANEKRIGASIKELGAINEMSLMIGLAMLTIGNFLGGVWANESWGRYWGWDPKETWALVTILVYAVVIHLRFIKSVYSDYAFAAISLLAFTSVLMTYFGVNYYLAGMHSYAKGDPVPVPDFVPVTYGIVFAIIAVAYRNRRLA